MQWLDLTAYGGIKLKVMARDPDPAVMFVLDRGDVIAEALRRAGFRRTMSGLWLRTFEPSDCASILSGLSLDLSMAVIKPTDPAEILLGARPVVAAPLVVEADVIEEEPSQDGEMPSVSALLASPRSEVPPADLVVEDRTDAAAEVEETSPRVSETGVSARTSTLHEAMAALAELAALIGCAPMAVATPASDETAEIAAADGVGAAGAQGIAMPVTEAGSEAEAVHEMEFSWLVSADAADARSLSGFPWLAERSYLVAKLAVRDGAQPPLQSVGALVRSASGGPDMRVVAVVRGIDGSGFGGASDILMIGDPGDGHGPLLARRVAEDTVAA